MSLRSGDVILLYTDGVTEAMNRKREMFGLAGLRALVRKRLAETPDQLVAAICDAAAAFAHSRSYRDDMTVVVLKVR